MKQTAIILLILSVVLSAVSCGRTGTQENSETPAQTENPAVDYGDGTDELDERGKTDETTDENDDNPETMSEAESETVSETDGKNLTENHVYFNVGDGSEIYYLTSSTDKSYGERGSEYTNENKVLAAVIFDSVPSRLMFNVYLNNIENIISGHENYYGWFDCCLYPLSDECMSGEAVSFVTQDEIYSLDGAEVLTGTTADGNSYCFYKTAGEGGAAARYYGFISLGDEHMASLMMSDDGKNAGEWEDEFKPMLDSARTYVSEEDSEIAYMTRISDGEVTYSIKYVLPDVWEKEPPSIASDLPRILDGRYSTKRFEGCSLFSPEEKDLEYSVYPTKYASEQNGITKKGYEYLIKTEESMSEGEKNLGVTWHHIWIRVPETTDEIYLRFVTYSDDEEGYYEKYCLPVLDSIEIEQLS